MLYGSSITREADYTLYTHAGPEIAVASTKAYTSQITLLVLLAINFAETLELPAKVNIILENTDKLKDFASIIHKEHDVFFVGRRS